MSEKRVVVWVQRFKDRPSLVLQWLDPDTGQRKSKSAQTADEKEAEQARADLEYQLNHGQHQEASRMSWDGFRTLFETEYVSGCRLHTRRNFADTLDLFVKICNPRNLKAISERTISLFLAGMRKTRGRAKGSTSLMASTIKVRLQFLHTVLSWAVSQKLLPAVPNFPTIKVPKKEPQPVPTEAVEKLIDKSGDVQMKAYLLCGWLAGLRLAEALELEREPTDSAPYLDLGRNRIILPAEFAKAVKDQWVPLDPVLREALEALPRQGRKVFRFVDRKGLILDAGAVSQQVRALAKRAGVRLTMKSLRKGFGCRYAGKVSAHVLQRLMRHANIKTTMDYYVNIDDAVEEAILGPRRNSSRNINHPAKPQPTRTDDATGYDGTSSVTSAD